MSDKYRIFIDISNRVWHIFIPDEGRWVDEDFATKADAEMWVLLHS